jgi:hypothetical protein
MRSILLILALIATPVLARDLPPEEPTYEKPSFEKPKVPEKPKEPEEPRKEYKPTPKPKPVSCPKVKCVTDENGHRRALFTADVQPDMYYLGRNFCAKAPKDVEVTACCLEKDDQTYQILYNVEVSKNAHWKATQFCTCVLELD